MKFIQLVQVLEGRFSYLMKKTKLHVSSGSSSFLVKASYLTYSYEGGIDLLV